MKIENLSGNPQAELISHIGSTHRYLAKMGAETPWDTRIKADLEIRQIKLSQLIAPCYFKNLP